MHFQRVVTHAISIPDRLCCTKLTAPIKEPGDYGPRGTTATRRTSWPTPSSPSARLRSPNPTSPLAVIAGAHSLSIRYLYELCAQADLSLEQWIITQRLERARRDLVTVVGRQRPHRAVAHAWCFSDASHRCHRSERPTDSPRRLVTLVPVLSGGPAVAVDGRPGPSWRDATWCDHRATVRCMRPRSSLSRTPTPSTDGLIPRRLSGQSRRRPHPLAITISRFPEGFGVPGQDRVGRLLGGEPLQVAVSGLPIALRQSGWRGRWRSRCSGQARAESASKGERRFVGSGEAQHGACHHGGGADPRFERAQPNGQV